MGGRASTERTIAPTGAPRANGVPAPTLTGLSRRNKRRLANGLMALLGSLDRESADDNELHAFLIVQLGWIDALLAGESEATP